MEDSCHLSNCSEQDVLLFGSTTCKLDQLRGEVSPHFSKPKLGEEITNSLKCNKHLHVDVRGRSMGRGYSYQDVYDKWFGDEIDCEILKLGAAGWQKGKVKINLNVTLEFCPDDPEVEEKPASNEQEISQPESPLDDIRLMIKNTLG